MYSWHLARSLSPSQLKYFALVKGIRSRKSFSISDLQNRSIAYIELRNSTTHLKCPTKAIHIHQIRIDLKSIDEELSKNIEIASLLEIRIKSNSMARAIHHEIERGSWTLYYENGHPDIWLSDKRIEAWMMSGRVWWWQSLFKGFSF